MDDDEKDTHLTARRRPTRPPPRPVRATWIEEAVEKSRREAVLVRGSPSIASRGWIATQTRPPGASHAVRARPFPRRHRARSRACAPSAAGRRSPSAERDRRRRALDERRPEVTRARTASRPPPSVSERSRRPSRAAPARRAGPAGRRRRRSPGRPRGGQRTDLEGLDRRGVDRRVDAGSGTLAIRRPNPPRGRAELARDPPAQAVDHGASRSTTHSPTVCRKRRRSWRRSGWPCQNSTSSGTSRRPPHHSGRGTSLPSG